MLAVGRSVARYNPVRLYLPEARAESVPYPLLVFAVERVPLWRREAPTVRVGRALRDRGVATVLVRIPPDGATIRARAESLAMAMGPMLRRALAEPGKRRIVFGGHGGAAEVVSALALDSGLLARAGLNPTSLAGVLALGGRFAATPRDAAVRDGARPVFLVITGADDTTEVAKQGRRFVRALEKSGVAPATFVLLRGRDAKSIADLSADDDLTRGVTAFVRGEPAPGLERPWFASRDVSADPPLSTESFGSDSSLVKRYPVSVKLRQMMYLILGGARSELRAYDLATYRAVDLLDYLATRSARDVGVGDHLVMTNIRGERTYLTRAEVERLRPQIVVGLDDEPNLFRLFAVYRPRLRYSWLKDEGPLPRMTRPVGGALLFPGQRPHRFPTAITVPSGLTPSSFRWQREDPLRSVRILPDSIQDVLIGASGCLHCHAFRGEGAGSQHVLLEDPSVRGGGIALALEQYPPDVLRAFLFEQERVAGMFGARPLVLSANLAAELEALVRAERFRRAP